MSTSKEFDAFINPTNYVAQILLLHFFCVEHMGGTYAMARLNPSFPFREHILTAWVRNVAGYVPDEYAVHLHWPVAYVESLHVVSSQPPLLTHQSTQSLPALVRSPT
jgi:hypothetical protein